MGIGEDSGGKRGRVMMGRGEGYGWEKWEVYGGKRREIRVGKGVELRV